MQRTGGVQISFDSTHLGNRPCTCTQNRVPLDRSIHVPLLQGFVAQWSTIRVQLGSLYPSRHLHSYPPIPSTHTLPSGHTTSTQSSTLMSQTLPSKPRGHSHTNSRRNLDITVQFPLFWQGFIAQTLYSRSQFWSMKSFVQLQVYPLIWSMHVPPFWQGCERHSSTLIWQFFPIGQTSFTGGCRALAKRNIAIIVVIEGYLLRII